MRSRARKKKKPNQLKYELGTLEIQMAQRARRSFLKNE